MQLEEQILGQLRDLKGRDGRPLLHRLITVYLEEAPRLMAVITEAMAADDREELGRAAHTLKSSSAQLGAAEFSETCLQLEYLGTGRVPFDNVSDVYRLAMAQLEEAMAVLAEERDRLEAI